jgi:hypothetical protein
MAFVNEYIPEEDYEKYGLDELDRSISPPAIPAGHIKSRDWTIDRKRNIYLRKFSSERDPDETPCTGWTFFWKGELLWFVRRQISSGGKKNGPQWRKSKITHLVIPDHLLLIKQRFVTTFKKPSKFMRAGGSLVMPQNTEKKSILIWKKERNKTYIPT